VTSLLHGTGALAFFQQWGWLVGILWLAAVVVWAANKPPDEEVQRVRTMERLGQATVNAVRRFEALSRAYERSISPENTGDAQNRRHELALAVAEVLRTAVQTVPEKQRYEYRSMLMGVLLNHLEFYDGQPTLFSAVLPPTLAIERALAMDAPPPPKKEGTSD
jgi:hypothetical protein